MLLKGRVVVITGASGGIGGAIALEAGRQGADVSLFARDSARLQEVAEKVIDLGRRAKVLVGDVRQREDVRRCIAETLDEFRRIDGLVNCAGVGVGPVPVDELTDEQWDLILDTNLRGPLYFVQEVAPYFTDNGQGAIVNVSSIAAKYKPGATSTAYVASKSGLCGMTRQMAVLLGPHGIRVNGVLPGNTVLERPDKSWASLSEADKERLVEEIPLRRFGMPEDQARAVVWLLSDQNTWITGENIAVSGGERTG